MAIDAFQAALDQGYRSPELLTDMASAYYQRARTDGNALELTRALELLGEAIRQDPAQTAALFNRAVIEGELSQVTPAIADLERLLTLERNGQWRSEAKRLIARLQSKRIGKNTEFHSLETDLDDILRHGLAAAHGSSLATRVAARLRDEHNDRWLGDLLVAAQRPENKAVVRVLAELADIRIAVETGRYSLLRTRLEWVEARPLDSSLDAWRSFELLFLATHVRGALQCTNLWPRPIKLGGYPWLRTQILREAGYCELQRGEIEAAAQYALHSVSLAETHRFAVAAVRSRGLLGHVELRRGRFKRSFEVVYSSLATIARDHLPLARSHEFHNLVMGISESLNRWNSARTAAAAMTNIAAEVGLRDLQFTNRVRWAQLSLRCGDVKEAVQLFGDAMRYYATIAPNDDRSWAAIGLAEASHDESLLSPFSIELERRRDSIVWIPYQRVRAQFALDRGDLVEAYRRLKLIEDWMSLGARARLPAAGRWRVEFDRFTDLFLRVLLAEHRIVDAFGFLQRVRSAEEGFPLRPLQTMNEEGAAMFALAVVGDRIGVWKNDGVRLEFRWAKGSVDDVVRRVRTLLRLLRDPASDTSEIAFLARGLQTALWGEWLDDIAPGRSIVVQVSRQLENIPLTVLPGRRGPLGFEHPLAMTSLAVGPCPKRSKWREGGSVVLVDASLAGAGVPDLPPLASAAREVENIAALFPGRARVLRGRDATPKMVERTSSGAFVLHFAGHATTFANDVVLVLSDGEETPVWFRFNDSATRARPHTVVLSACSTTRRSDDGDGGDDVGTLADALLRQGTAEVVGSLWDVNSEATAVLMEKFYGAVADGRESGVALATAMRAVQRSAPFRHPYYWAGFVRYVRM